MARARTASSRALIRPGMMRSVNSAFGCAPAWSSVSASSALAASRTL